MAKLYLGCCGTVHPNLWDLTQNVPTTSGSYCEMCRFTTIVREIPDGELKLMIKERHYITGIRRELQEKRELQEILDDVTRIMLEKAD